MCSDGPLQLPSGTVLLEGGRHSIDTELVVVGRGVDQDQVRHPPLEDRDA